MKMVRTAALVAVVTTAVTKAREYAREHPDQAAENLDKAEGFLRSRAAPKYGAYLDKGSAGIRQGLGLPARRATSASTVSDLDLDPDLDRRSSPHGPQDPVAPNPAPGTTDDPQPRRQD